MNAEVKLRQALDRLIAKYPVIGGLLATWELIARPVKTMAIGLGPTGFRLYYDPEFVAQTRLDILVGVLHHEARHVLYGHLLIDRNSHPDETALLIAMECCVNERLPEPLTADAIRHRRFNLPANEDTETRYKRLAQMNNQQAANTAKPSNPAQPDQNSGGSLKARQKASGSSAQPEPQTAQPAEQSQGQEESPGPNQDPAQAPQARSAEGGPADMGAEGHGAHQKTRNPARSSQPAQQTDQAVDQAQRQSNGAKGVHGKMDASDIQPIDDHSTWHEVQEREVQARAEIAQALQRVYQQRGGNPSKQELKELKSIGGNWDLDAGSYLSVLPDAPQHQGLPWQRLLRTFVGRNVRRQDSLKYPPRRFPELAGIVPGRANTCVAPNILAGIDTSESMSEPVLAMIARELGRLAATSKVLVVEFDSRIQRVYPFRHRIERVHGRGGTDFRPVLAPKFLRKHRPDVVLLFTDGDGPAPEEPPRMPVLWILVADYPAPVTWGTQIKMHGPDQISDEM